MSHTPPTGRAARPRPRVKICGLTCEADRDIALGAGADALGFIADVPVDTPRELSVDRAAALVAGAGPFVNTVLVTMPDSVEDAVAVHEHVGADTLQVHGGLSPAEVTQLNERLEATVLVAVDVHDERAESYATASDGLLVDSTDEQGAGGTGETHDWERTRCLVERLDTPVVLAGGLTPENVETAIETVDPFAVDTATGVEGDDGRKDHDAVEAFVARATRAGVSA